MIFLLYNNDYYEQAYKTLCNPCNLILVYNITTNIAAHPQRTTTGSYTNSTCTKANRMCSNTKHTCSIRKHRFTREYLPLANNYTRVFTTHQ